VGEVKSRAVDFHLLQQCVNNTARIGEQFAALLTFTQMRSLDFK